MNMLFCFLLQPPKILSNECPLMYNIVSIHHGFKEAWFELALELLKSIALQALPETLSHV